MKIKSVVIMVLLLGVSAPSWAQYGSKVGMGYISKADSTKIYKGSTGEEVDATVKKGFPLVAYSSSSIMGGMLASESISDGRLHVRYWKNGIDAEGGENWAWVDPKDVNRFSFDCCGDEKCSGTKAVLFKTRTSTDCFNMALSEALAKSEKAGGDSNAELEKLKLQLEIEKLKLEAEKLKQTETK